MHSLVDAIAALSKSGAGKVMLKLLWCTLTSSIVAVMGFKVLSTECDLFLGLFSEDRPNLLISDVFRLILW